MIDRIRELPEGRRRKVQLGASRIVERAAKPVKSRIKIETTPTAE